MIKDIISIYIAGLAVSAAISVILKVEDVSKVPVNVFVGSCLAWPLTLVLLVLYFIISYLKYTVNVFWRLLP